MSFYDDLAATAHEAIAEFGTAVVLTRTTPGAYNPALGKPGAGTTENFTGVGARFDYAQRDIDGTRIRQGDQRVYLSVVGLVLPQTGDMLTIGGAVFHVVESRPLQPALTAVMYDVQVRGVQ